MDSESKAVSGVPWSQGLILALLLGLGTVFIADSPYVTDRRQDSLLPGNQAFSQQDVDARLWQDPLGVIQRALQAEAGKAKPVALEGQASVTAPEVVGSASAADVASAPGSASRVVGRAPSPHSVELLKRDLDTYGDRSLVLTVMLRGGSYSEFVEERRRTRHAVLAGLSEMGYAPSDSDHLGWFVPGDSPGARLLPAAIPYEWLYMDPERVLARAGDSRAKVRNVLVLWLDDRAFLVDPVARMNVLAQALSTGDPAQARPWRVIGPVRSDALQAMYTESQKPTSDAQRASYERLHFYAATPTVPDDIMMGRRDVSNPVCLLASTLQKSMGITLARTIGNDAALSRALIDELDLRGLRSLPLHDPKGQKSRAYGEMCYAFDPKRPASETPSRIAVVAEWDSLYGRSLLRLFQPAEDRPGYCVSSFSYMRGLDGLLPDQAKGDGEDGEAKPSATKGRSEDRRKDGSFIERAEGQSQFDYLRRLAKQMHERDLALRAQGGQGLQAIGVLGNDVHDKLLVLQALQPEFPTAMFFTTDLDARYLHPKERTWTRNLIVASNFGLRLDDRLQRSTPPFRDGYQTSLFFTTRLVVDDAVHALDTGSAPAPGATTCPHEATAAWVQEDFGDWLKHPRIFEVGRTRAFDFTGRAADDAPAWLARRPVAQTAPPRGTGGQSCWGPRWLDCDDIHPAGSDPAPMPRLVARWLCCALLLALWIPVRATYDRGYGPMRGWLAARIATSPPRWGAIMGVGLLLVLQVVVLPLGLAVAWPHVAGWMTAGGKPLVLTEGISVWPTQFIRLAILLLGLYFLLRSWRGLERNQEDISKTFSLCATREAIEAAQKKAEEKLSAFGRVMNVFWWDRVTPQGPIAQGRAGVKPKVEYLWQRHVVQNRLHARLMRTSVLVLLMLLLLIALMHAFDEPSGMPSRGRLSMVVHLWLPPIMYIVFSYVVFFIVDATLLCVSFLPHLRAQCVWPAAAIEDFRRKLSIRDEGLVAHWINLKLVACRTEELNRLVYIPFIMISLIVLSRNPAFDDWQMPLAAGVAMMLWVLIAVGCAAAVRISAEKARRAALEAFDAALLRSAAAEGSPEQDAPREPAVKQLEFLRGQITRLRDGAFAPYSQQPVLKALMLPFATFGGSTLLEYLSLANM